jgi:hypothetical protein
VRKYALAVWKKGHLPVLRQKGMNLDSLTLHESYGYDPEKLAEALRVTDLPDGGSKIAFSRNKVKLSSRIKAGDDTTAV